MSPPFYGKNLAQRRRFPNQDYYNRDPQSDYGSQDYFGPLQPVNSGASDEEKLYVLSPALHERLIQEFGGDAYTTELSGQESAPQTATASAAGALIFLLLILIIGCCVVPCLYLLRDTNLGQSVKEALKQVKKTPKSPYPYTLLKSDTTLQRPPPPVSGPKTYESESEPKKRKKHKRPKQTIEIPFSSEESVDIYIHGGDDDEDCPVADKNSEEFYFKDCPVERKCLFKPVKKYRQDKHRSDKRRLQTVHEELCLSSSDDEDGVDVYSRYANPSKKQHSNYYTPTNVSPTRTEVGPLDAEEVKSQKYDDLIRNWKTKQRSEGGLGPPPPFRKSNKNNHNNVTIQDNYY